jgi:hypothetical protein
MAVSTSQTPFITVTKSFSWRGSREHWSNVYHVDTEPPTAVDWDALLNKIWALEWLFLPADVQIEGGTGHTPGTPPVLVWESDSPPVGEGGIPGAFVPAAGDHLTPGDVAGWVRWTSDLKNKRGKPIYFRNYYHAMYVGADGNTIVASQQANMTELGRSFQAGLVANGRTYRRTGPNHGSPQDHASSIYATTRTLERRGKRKKLQPASSGSGLFDAIEKSLAAKGLITIIEDALAAGAA